jgi:Mg-chelatase subunit ChlD
MILAAEVFMIVRHRLIAAGIAALFCVTATGQQGEQTIPVSMVVVLDTSGSMGPHMPLARKLLSEVLNPANSLDEFVLVQAADRPVVIGGFGSTAEALREQLTFTQSRGRSALLDAVYLGVQVAKTGRNARKVLVVVSDGSDNSSRYTNIEIKYAIQGAGVHFYAIGLDESNDGSTLLSHMAEQGRGRYVAVATDSDSARAAKDLGAAMRARQ